MCLMTTHHDLSGSDSNIIDPHVQTDDGAAVLVETVTGSARARTEPPSESRHSAQPAPVDELRLLGDLPHAARVVGADREHPLRPPRVDAQHVRLVPEQRVHVRAVVQAPDLRRTTGGVESAGCVLGARLHVLLGNGGTETQTCCCAAP